MVVVVVVVVFVSQVETNQIKEGTPQRTNGVILHFTE